MSNLFSPQKSKVVLHTFGGEYGFKSNKLAGLFCGIRCHFHFKKGIVDSTMFIPYFLPLSKLHLSENTHLTVGIQFSIKRFHG